MTADIDMPQLISILEAIESQNNPDAIGDVTLKNKAYGILQIRQPCLDDYNKWNRTSHTIDDVLGQKGVALSRDIFEDYMAHYATPKRLGRPVTALDMARIWNGGPNGWKKEATLKYSIKVKKIARDRGTYYV